MTDQTSERYRLNLDERPSVNGMLLDSEMERTLAVQRGDMDRSEIMAKRAEVLRRLLAAFPVDAQPEFQPVTTLALCESESLVLQPERLYRFVVMPDCARCAELAKVGRP